MTPTHYSRETMAGKPVLYAPARSVINMNSGFAPKLLCDGPAFSTGLACVYSCTYCYVPSVYRKLLHGVLAGRDHSDVVVRREDALKIMRGQLLKRDGSPKYYDATDTRVIYSSPAVDVAANMELVAETVEACKLILELTNWQIRLLSKSSFLPIIAQRLLEWSNSILPGHDDHRNVKGRMIFGVSTGTLDDKLAAAIEPGTAKVSKRIASIHRLQDEGWRTFGMIYPSLPQNDYRLFADEMHKALRADRMEHVWAEPINVRGQSMERTYNALQKAGFKAESGWLAIVSGDKEAWEDYARKTFLAHRDLYEPGQLRFLQYVNDGNRLWWQTQQEKGAVLL